MAKEMPEEIGAIFEYIKEKVGSDNWNVTNDGHLTIQPDGKVGGWTLHSYVGSPKAWDIKITLFNSARIHVEFFYYRANTRGRDQWEKFDYADLLDDIEFKRVDQALHMLDTLKGGMKNFGNFNEFGDFTGKAWGK